MQTCENISETSQTQANRARPESVQTEEGIGYPKTLGSMG